jgi:hypothetical protein
VPGMLGFLIMSLMLKLAAITAVSAGNDATDLVFRTGMSDSVEDESDGTFSK